MSHKELIKDMDSCFEIDPITRQIRNTSPSKVSVVQYDHNSERFKFSLARFIEGHDMATSNRVEVHYITKGGTAGVYEITDLEISEDDENKVVCSWLLSQNATKDTGALAFLLRFSCVASDGTIEYVWNSGIYSGITVADGMYNAAAIVEQYADVLEQWKQELSGNSGGAALTDDQIANINDIPNIKKDIEEINQDAERIVEEVYSAIADLPTKAYVDEVIENNGGTKLTETQLDNIDYVPTLKSDVTDLTQTIGIVQENLEETEYKLGATISGIYSNLDTKAGKTTLVSFANNATITLADNTEYIASENISNLTIIYPESNFICSLTFTTASDGIIYIDLPDSKYLGKAPTFENGETWELSIKNGVVVGGVVK